MIIEFRMKQSPCTRNWKTDESVEGERIIFESYSHEDGKFLEEFKTNMVPLLRGSPFQFRLDLWDDMRAYTAATPVLVSGRGL